MRISLLSVFFISLLLLLLARYTHPIEVEQKAVMHSHGLPESNLFEGEMHHSAKEKIKEKGKKRQNPKPRIQESTVEVIPPRVIHKCKKVCEEKQRVWWNEKIMPKVPETFLAYSARDGNEMKIIEDENTDGWKSSQNGLSLCVCVNKKVADFFLRDYRHLVNKDQKKIKERLSHYATAFRKNIESAATYLSLEAKNVRDILNGDVIKADEIFKKILELESCRNELRNQNLDAEENRNRLVRQGQLPYCYIPNLSEMYLEKTRDIKIELKNKQEEILNELVRVSAYYQNYIDRFPEYNLKCLEKELQQGMLKSMCKDQNTALLDKVSRYIAFFLKKAAKRVSLLSNKLQMRVKERLKEIEKKREMKIESEIENEIEKEMENEIKNEKNIEEEIEIQIENVKLKTKSFRSDIRYYHAILESNDQGHCIKECAKIGMVLSYDRVHFPATFSGFVRYKDTSNNIQIATITSDVFYTDSKVTSGKCFCIDLDLKLAQYTFTSSKLLDAKGQDEQRKEIRKLMESRSSFLDFKEMLPALQRKLKVKEVRKTKELKKCMDDLQIVTFANKLMPWGTQPELSTYYDYFPGGTLTCHEKIELAEEPFKKKFEVLVDMYSKQKKMADIYLKDYTDKISSSVQAIMRHYMDKKQCLGIAVHKGGECIRMYPQETFDKETNEKLPLLHDDFNTEIKTISENYKDLNANPNLKKLKNAFEALVQKYRTNFLV